VSSAVVTSNSLLPDASDPPSHTDYDYTRWYDSDQGEQDAQAQVNALFADKPQCETPSKPPKKERGKEKRLKRNPLEHTSTENLHVIT
jgi:hypothetical protein